MASASARQPLTLHDQDILGKIIGATDHFDPSNLVSCIDLSLPPDRNVPREVVEEFVEDEKRAIRLEALGRVEEATSILEGIITRAPKYASAYNNRAQLNRGSIEDADSVMEKVISDLETAIALASPETRGTAISKMRASVLRNAYNQLGSIYLVRSRRPEFLADAWSLQLKASDMLAEAGRYGEQISTALSTRINPYAKLCGNMIELALSTTYK